MGVQFSQYFIAASGLGTLVRDDLTLYLKVYFWTTVCALCQYHFDLVTVVLSFEINYMASEFIL